MKYLVYATVVYEVFEVEADSEDDAVDKAGNMLEDQRVDDTQIRVYPMEDFNVRSE